MFFCQICNYSNPTAKGVLNHQRKKHVDIKATAKQIVEYTATLCKSKPVQEDSQPEEGTVFYCQYCDYDNPTVRGVLSHQKLKHSDQKATADQVVTYTAVVCRPNKKSKIHQPNISSMKASQSCMQKSAPLRSIKNHRSLKCRNCSYTTPHIYLLKRHLRNNHQEKAPITTIISWAYQDGYLQAGYHCEWCVCSHTEAKGLLRHYRQRHPDKNTGLESIILRLRAVQKTSTSFQSRGDTKVYPCRACPFKATSMGGISSHYRVVHPWSVKEDGSVLDVISSRQTQEPEVQEPLDNNETSVSSETYRCPVCSSEFPTLHGMSTHCGKKHPEHDTKVHEEPDVRETSKPSLRFRCPVCPGVFNTLHGMLTHCGKKHPEHDTSTYEKVPEEEPSSSEGTLVFKCSACPYVNTRAHGVLTHSQMRHPAVKVSTERLDQEIVHFTNPDECVVVRSGRRMGLAGFRCNMCPVIHAKFKILKTHYEMDHKRSSSNMFKPAIKQSAAIKKQLISKYRGSQTSIVQAAILKKGKSIFIKCHLCKYFCTTKKGLARHLLINHSTLAQNEDREFSYKCALCSYTTLICKYLAAHYRRQHGNAAFNAHFVPAFRPLRVPPTSPNHEDSLNQEMKSPGEKIKCSCCFFQCLSEKGMVSHYAICHPGVSPVKPDSSKASPNKTAHTPLKPRPRPRHQKPVCKIFDPQCEEGNAWCPVKCKKCENLFFNSSLLLSIHYTNFHKEDFKQDFVILSKTSEDSIEFYKCEHCNIEIQGNADLSTHLDLHNDESLKLANEHRPSPQHLRDPAPNTSETQPPTPQRPSPQHLRDPVLTPEESDSHWIVTKVESVATGMGPLLFPSKSLRTEPEGQSVGEECKHCGRTFKSLKGLRSHERSHAATAALKRLENVPHQQKQMFDRHIRHRPGTIKPFHCTLCRYRTTILSLLKNHLLKVHGGETTILLDHTVLAPHLKITGQSPGLGGSESFRRHVILCLLLRSGFHLAIIKDCNQFSDSEGSDLTESKCPLQRAYSEPPDVLRQLKHYRHLAQAKAPGPPEPKSTGTTQDGLFACEFCTYTSTYIKSMRRHYISRHNGKRIVRCKDCSFFTGFSVIIEAVKDLHCPLCLYHTKNKKRMIDHIILHREEPLAPIEVRRPKLSRYLQGIVFRCHKCTFTSSSDESLRLHMHKHNDLKPYKCRLCYFDCTQLSELEAHLCDMHQVSVPSKLLMHAVCPKPCSLGGSTQKQH
uniref:C2H2-type domain-containing protein n=1 Tax=Esox lucius TaxID=8010 RepID=A0A6Q2Z1G3_ESOLU